VIKEFSTAEREFPHAITDFFVLQSRPFNLSKRYVLLDRTIGMNERGGEEVALRRVMAGGDFLMTDVFRS
jgi:hypothetical protein